MARISDFLDEIYDFVIEIFIKKSEEEKAYPIEVRKQREILAAVGDEDKANLVKDTMCIIGFDAISDNATWKAVVDFYKTLDWDKKIAKKYLDKFVLLRDAISNSKKQQFSRLNKNSKVDNVAILQDTVDLLNSDLTTDEIKRIMDACTLTGSEITEARNLWEKEKERVIEEGYEGEESIEEAEYFYDKMVNLARLTTDTTLTDARDVIGRGTYEIKSSNKVEKIKEIVLLIAEALKKKNPENKNNIELMSVSETKINEVVHGLDYNKTQIEALEAAVFKGKLPNKQVYNRTLKEVAKEFIEFYNYNDRTFSTDKQTKRKRKKALVYAIVLGTGIGVVSNSCGLDNSKNKDKLKEPPASERLVENTESNPIEANMKPHERPMIPPEFRTSSRIKTPVGSNAKINFDSENGIVTCRVKERERIEKQADDERV